MEASEASLDSDMLAALAVPDIDSPPDARYLGTKKTIDLSEEVKPASSEESGSQSSEAPEGAVAETPMNSNPVEQVRKGAFESIELGVNEDEWFQEEIIEEGDVTGSEDGKFDPQPKRKGSFVGKLGRSLFGSFRLGRKPAMDGLDHHSTYDVQSLVSVDSEDCGEYWLRIAKGETYSPVLLSCRGRCCYSWTCCGDAIHCEGPDGGSCSYRYHARLYWTRVSLMY